MEHARHVFRIALLLAVVITVVILARALLVPRSYGMYGAYRFDNVAEQASIRKPLHGGAQACGECHPAEFQKRSRGAHQRVSCEICHAPLGVHVVDGAPVGDMPIDRSFTLCARCHRRIAGRPARFPQVVLEQHVPGPVEGKVCLDCHDPHSPKP